MRLIIKLYSILRDIIGDEIVLNVEGPIKVKELLSIIRRDFNVSNDIELFAIIDNEVKDEEYTIIKETVIHITPSFAGGSKLVDIKLLRETDRIDFNELIKKLTSMNPEAGAMAMFIGFVKEKVEGNDVYELEYTALEEAAIKQLEKIALEELEKFNLESVVIWHYIGRLKPGDITVVIATVARKRGLAIEASSTILERVKKEVPLFKLEKRSNGHYWVVGNGKRYRSSKDK